MIAGQGSALHVEVSCPPGDPLAGTLRLIGGMPSWEPARQECEAQVYLALARSAWREADRLRGLQQHREARKQRRRA